MPEHSVLTDPNIHEPKGISGAAANTVYVANGSGSGVWTNAPVSGWWDYNDGSGSIALPAGVWTTLTNDGAGANTVNTYALPGAGSVWNTGTNRFDLSNLSLGDTVDVRFQVSVTTASSNTAIDMRLVMAQGTASEFTLPVMAETNFKTAAVHVITHYTGFYVGSTAVKNNPVAVQMRADALASVVVDGWYIRVVKR